MQPRPKAVRRNPRPQTLEKTLANRLCATGAVYATVFGSVARGEERFDSDIDVAASFGKPMSSNRKMAVMAVIAKVSGRSVDLIDLEKAEGLILARALGGREILCDSVATRTRMAVRLMRSEDDRMSVGQGDAQCTQAPVPLDSPPMPHSAQKFHISAYTPRQYSLPSQFSTKFGK